jgi:hypothetical protein
MLDAPYFLSQYNSFKATALKNRYITNAHIEPLLASLTNRFSRTILGTSEGGLPIHALEIGTGSKRILIWSQMHGNESTTTKAIFDLCNYFELSDSKALLEACTLFIIPILNPDGAEAYTRFNKNQVDLNRDAKALTQSESKILRTSFESFKPNFCFNMHGQRTIFSAGNTSNSAVLSFLSPSENKERSLTITRQKSMEIIQFMNSTLQPYLTNQIGRYDDAFNDNCVGDYFQSIGTPTVLFEAGHFNEDYSREVTRKYMALALISAIDFVANNPVSGAAYKPYLDIPENDKNFYDVIVRNALLNTSKPGEYNDIGIQHTEVLESCVVLFKPKVVFVGDLTQKYGHMEIDANFKVISHPNFEVLSIGNEIDFIMKEFTKIPLFINNNLM